MARHLADLPLMFWGQGYKGVPEVYLTAPVFAAFGAGVIQLKSVTLALWAIAVALVTRLAQRWHGDRVAWMTAALVVTGPPALAFWSLSGNAEYAILIALSAALCLDYQRGVDTPLVRSSRSWLWCGIALWIHPAGVCLVVAFVTVRLLGSQTWRGHGWSGLARVLLVAEQPVALRTLVLVLQTTVVVVMLIFVFTYSGGSVHLGPIRATHPQRSLRAIAVLCGLITVAHVFAGTVMPRRRALPALAWFLAGITPLIIQAVRGDLGTSVITRGLSDAPLLVKQIALDLVPIVVGLQDPFGGPLSVPAWLAMGLAAGAAVSLIGGARVLVASRSGAAVRPDQAFALLAGLAMLGLLVVGGAFQGSTSSRYVMALMGVFAIAVAAGLDWILSRNRAVGGALLAGTLLFFALGQLQWRETLVPDRSARLMIDCLAQHDVRAAIADYWTAYRLTFLSGERLVVVPDDPVGDRYRPYRNQVRAAHTVASIREVRGEARDSTGEPTVICRTPTLTATVLRRPIVR